MNSPTFSRVERRTVADEIREVLLNSIMAGQFTPGDPLPSERDLCDQFGVARTSLREAMQGLASLGYLERKGNRTHVVEHLPEFRVETDQRKERVRQLFETRRVVEIPIAEMAARRANDAQRAALDKLATEFERELTLDEFRPLDRSFHAAISAACGNPLLAELHGKVLVALFESENFSSMLRDERNEDEVRRIVGESSAAHLAIARAIASGEPEDAAAAVCAHLDEVEARILDRLH